MATERSTGRKTARPATVKAAPKGVKPKAVAPAPAPAPVAAPEAEACDADVVGASGLWRAGLKALDTVRQDVTRRHTNVIETLLGIAPARTDADPTLAARSFPGLEGLGLRKFEDVFDQRVASSLERLDVPTREELQALRTQLEQVLAHLDRLGGKAPAPRKPRGTPTGGGTKR